MGGSDNADTRESSTSARLSNRLANGARVGEMPEPGPFRCNQYIVAWRCWDAEKRRWNRVEKKGG